MGTRALAQVHKLAPTPDQRAALARLVGCRRFVYNWALATRRAHHRATGSHLASAALSAALTRLKREPDRAWLADVASRAVQQALRDRDRAYANWFAKRARPPRFASKHRGARTARIPQRVTVDEATGAVRLPKIGAVRLRRSRPLVGVIKSATVRRDACGDRRVSLRLEAPALVDAPVPPEEAARNAVGIDLGLTTYATLSTGEAVSNPRHLRSRQRALARAQRARARKRRGGANRDTDRRKVARLHRTVARRRADSRHKLTTRLVREHDLLCVEDLSIAGLARTTLARPFADAALGEFLRQIRYKADWHGKHVVAVGRSYPSSKTCGGCGQVHAGLAPTDRVWVCPACGRTHDRDANAARNLLSEGTRLFALRGPGALSGGPAGRPGASRPIASIVAAGSPETCNARGRPIGRPPGRRVGFRSLRPRQRLPAGGFAYPVRGRSRRPATCDRKRRMACRSCPGADVARGIVIGMAPVAAARTGERLPVAPADRPTLAARLRRVGRRARLDRHARQSRLVPDRRRQIVVRPCVPVRGGVASDRSCLRRFADARRISQPDAATLLDGETHERLRDAVVAMLDHPRLARPEASDRLVLARRLQLAPQAGVVATDMPDALARPGW